jgi:hypothetical protein
VLVTWIVASFSYYAYCTCMMDLSQLLGQVAHIVTMCCCWIELNQFIEANISLPQEGETDIQPTHFFRYSVYGD